jgi:uncharacterized protein
MLQAQIFIDKDDMINGQFVHEFIMQFLITQKITGATLFRGRLGYGANQHLNRPNDLFSFDETPMMITLVDEDEKVKAAITQLRQQFTGGFIITHPVQQW